jgi:allantoate deiminase
MGGSHVQRSDPIRVDPALVEQYLMELAQFGAYGETGVWRVVYSPEWVAAQSQVAAWCVEAGLRVRRDAIGNLWGRLDGAEGGKAIVSGSHIDTQRPGGRYDGALGVIAALTAIRTLRERYGTPRRPLELLSLCEEESSRFPAANLWASRAITGAVRADEPETIRSYDGETMAETMRAVGLDPTRIGEAVRDDIDTFIELHIEQGPILEQADLPVAIVNAITGIRHYVVELRGSANHAGAFPMDLRRDPMAGAAEIIAGVINTAHRMGLPAVTTVGRILAEPNYPAIVPEKVTFTIDARHPDPAARRVLYAKHEALVQEVAARRDLDVTWQLTIDHPPCVCDPPTVELLAEAAREQGLSPMIMASGAGHDSQRMAEIAKVAMIFVQSKDGRSHTPEEFTSIEHCVAGIEVLAAGLYNLAYRGSGSV